MGRNHSSMEVPPPNIQTNRTIEANNFVIIANSQNFKEVVTDSGRDAFVEFYSPWCGFCHKIAPVWDQLADTLKDEDVDIIKFDATGNNWPESLFKVTKYPTFYWKQKENDSEPVKYEGCRSFGDFLKFVAEHASSELNGWDRKGKVKKQRQEDLQSVVSQ